MYKNTKALPFKSTIYISSQLLETLNCILGTRAEYQKIEGQNWSLHEKASGCKSTKSMLLNLNLGRTTTDSTADSVAIKL